VHFTQDYLSGTFNSCRNVQYPSTGQLALDLMCGAWGAAACSPIRWFSYMGDINTPAVPFQINYIAHNGTEPVDNIIPNNPKVIPCSESVDVSDESATSDDNSTENLLLSQGVRPACSCVDCVSSCPKPPPPEPLPQPFRIWGLDGYFFVMFFIFLLGSGMFVMGTGYCSSSEAGELTSTDVCVCEWVEKLIRESDNVEMEGTTTTPAPPATKQRQTTTKITRETSPIEQNFLRCFSLFISDPPINRNNFCRDGKLIFYFYPSPV
jgi:hypothetical protein